mmetsp:Transcript_81720/g.210419  ORF Transcript_81720/g.210419 Transcript_81720/m.210419 type:complete len:242 (+) Transcript_81720:1387-2112(+)
MLPILWHRCHQAQQHLLRAHRLLHVHHVRHEHRHDHHSDHVQLGIDDDLDEPHHHGDDDHPSDEHDDAHHHADNHADDFVDHLHHVDRCLLEHAGHVGRRLGRRRGRTLRHVVDRRQLGRQRQLRPVHRQDAGRLRLGAVRRHLLHPLRHHDDHDDAGPARARVRARGGHMDGEVGRAAGDAMQRMVDELQVGRRGRLQPLPRPARGLRHAEVRRHLLPPLRPRHGHAAPLRRPERRGSLR